VTRLRATWSERVRASRPGPSRAPALPPDGPRRPDARGPSQPNPQKERNCMTPAEMIAGILFALTLPLLFNATTQADTRLCPWSHHTWLKVAAASRRCSLSQQRRDASATIRRPRPAGFGARARQRRFCARTALLDGKRLNWHPNHLNSIRFPPIWGRWAKPNRGEYR
jgi:hypothetical protein